MVLPAYSADYLTSILSAFKDLIFLFDGEGIILDYLQTQNAEWLYIPKEQFIGKHHKEVLPPDVSEKIHHAIKEVKNGKNTSTFDYHLSIRGKIAWFTAVFSPIQKNNGRAENYLCVIREITERKEQELLLHGVLENAFNAFIVLRAVRNTEGRVIDFLWLMVNHEAEKLIRISAADLKGRQVKGMSDQPWILFAEYVSVAETGTPLDLEYCIEVKGSRIWMHTHGLKLGDDIVVTIKDITEKKQAELNLQSAMEQLRLSQLGLDMFFSQALTGFFFMMLDTPLEWNEGSNKAEALNYAIDHLHFTRVNDALLLQYGTTRNHLLNLTLKDFFTGDLETARNLLRQLYDNKRIQINRVSKKMDGTPIWVEGYYICFTDEKNRILGHFGIQQDVTERQRAGAELAASEERYRLLANNMLDLVALHDPDGTYQYVSPSVIKILGYTPEELIGTNPYRLFHPDDIRRIQEQSHRKAIKGEIIREIEYRIQKKDGTYVWFSTNTKPIIDSEGKIIMLQTLSRDVTEKIKALNALEELNHQKNKMFSIIAHDLRGPLASCIGLLNLTRTNLTTDELQKYLRLASRSAFNLHELMEDLLLWAGSQLDKLSFDPAILYVQEEVEAVCRRFAEMTHAKEITVTVRVEDESLCVYADRDMIRTIIRNLLSNAIKFTAPKGSVEIHAKASNGLVEISVQDNGVGINKEDIAKLFSKTSNFTTYGTSGEKGTGLGLDICQDFAEKHGGKLRVESEVGKGSRFTFTLKEF